MICGGIILDFYVLIKLHLETNANKSESVSLHDEESKSNQYELS